MHIFSFHGIIPNNNYVYKLKINLTYSVNNKLIPDFYSEVLGYYGLSAKNIKNSALFIINNIFSSYSYNKDSDSYFLKNNLHDNQQEIFEIINSTINHLNKKLKIKFDQNMAKFIHQKEINTNNSNNTKIKEPKLVQFNLYSEIIDSKTYYQILDKSLLENVIKHKEKIKPEYKDYTIVHSHLAQSVLQKLCDEFSHYFKAVKSFSKDKDSFTGKPKAPNYKSKTSAISFDISIQRFSKQGKILTITKNHKVYKDYDKTKLIDQELIANFNSFNLLEAINQDIENKGLDKLNSKVIQVRIIPSKYKQKPKIEYVLSYDKELKGFYPDLLAKSQNEKNKDFFKLKDKEKLSLIKDYFNHDYVKVNPKNPIPYFMGIDCGLVNFAAICIFNQYRDLNYIVSGRTLKNKIIKIDTKLDKAKSNLTTEEIKAIQSKKDKNQQLTRVELTQLKQFHKDLSIDPILIEFQLRKANITNDFVHKLSKGLIQDCLNKEIKVIIVGKNKGQKNEINLGSKTNRAMYNFPHAQFIEILKYKAMLNDILVVETEESYTSKTSFIDNEDLAEYNKTTQGTKSQLSGKRVNQVFITKNKIKLHADINGSFNIVRKVLKSFQYDKEKMSLSYNLVELNLQGKNKFYAFCGPLAKSHTGFYPL